MNATATVIVARYNFAEQAAQSATLRTISTGRPHYAQHDTDTDTHVVTAEVAPAAPAAN